MTDKLENYQENNQTAYKGTASDDSITITDIDFSGSFVYTFEGNDTLVLENPKNKLEIYDGLGSDNYTLIESSSFDYNLDKESLLNKTNRDELTSFLDKNINRNLLNINYWNKKLIIDNYSKQKNNNFEKSFMNLFILTKNNKQKNLDLKKYFVVNYNYFSEENKKKILENYN